jgi:hypothetical protein
MGFPEAAGQPPPLCVRIPARKSDIVFRSRLLESPTAQPALLHYPSLRSSVRHRTGTQSDAQQTAQRNTNTDRPTTLCTLHTGLCELTLQPCHGPTRCGRQTMPPVYTSPLRAAPCYPFRNATTIVTAGVRASTCHAHHTAMARCCCHTYRHRIKCRAILPTVPHGELRQSRHVLPATTSVQHLKPQKPPPSPRSLLPATGGRRHAATTSRWTPLSWPQLQHKLLSGRAAVVWTSAATGAWGIPTVAGK